MKRRQPQFARKQRVESPRERPVALPPQLVTIEKPIYGGAFLARVEGKAVFVPLTLPGEQARVRITEDKGGYAKAEVDEIVAPAPIRIAPTCRHFGVCGGCNYQHTNYEKQLTFKEAILRETLERGGVRAPEEIKVLAAATEEQSWRYRNRIRLAIDAAGNPGYRSRRSHAVIPISECPIAAPLLLEAAQIFAEVGRHLFSAFRPTEISLFCDREESELLASVYSAGIQNTGTDAFADLSKELAARIPALKGIELVVEVRTGDKGKEQTYRTAAKWGESSLNYRTGDFDYRVDQGAFFQVNRWLIDGLVERVTAGQNGELAWDLFSGVGLFARKLTSNFARVVAVESAPQSTAALEANLRDTNGMAVKTSTLDFLRRSNQSERPNLIIVDPPRSGLGSDVTAPLANIAAPHLVYVSCDPATLARDLRPLLESGYSIESVTLVDLFPHTFHLETVVHLSRS